MQDAAAIDDANAYDVLIVGGGPAGLSAALVLARACRRVVVCDEGQPRNAASHALNGYLSRDGIPPAELLHLGRAELARYGVEIIPQAVRQARCCAEPPWPAGAKRFVAELADGRRLSGRRLLLATGVRDVLPQVPGLRDYYGRGVHHCPYCDGWEYRGRPLVALGQGARAVGLALALRTWSDRVTACTGPTRVDPAQRARCAENGIALRRERIVRLEGAGPPEGRLERVIFESGPPLECAALFFHTQQWQQSQLAAALGCGYTPAGHISTRHRQRTRVPGLFLAGDADGDVQFAIVAAAEGATAAVAINRELQDEDCENRARAGARDAGAH